MNKVRIVRISGDITKMPGAIMTAVNSSGAWFGGIDRAIYNAAGKIYHNQLGQAAMNGRLSDLETVVAVGNHNLHNGEFDQVVFVVDDLESPLRKVIKAGLIAADNARIKKISIPAIRTGVMIGMVERSLEDISDELIEGIKEYFKECQNPYIEAIAFVTYNNPELDGILHNAIKREGW